MMPDYELAARKATEMLIKHQISTAPVFPLPVFKRTPGCLVLLLQKCPAGSGVDRDQLVSMFDAEQRDAVTSIHFKDGKLRYLVNYNQRLPFYLLQRALARELGHIVLGHDGSKPEEIRMAEAQCFAHHFLCPPPPDPRYSGVRHSVHGGSSRCYDRLL